MILGVFSVNPSLTSFAVPHANPRSAPRLILRIEPRDPHAVPLADEKGPPELLRIRWP